MTYEEACQILGVTSLDPPGQVRRARLRLAAIQHPDHGGTAEKFSELTAAYELVKNFQMTEDCSQCHGQKTIQARRGFHAIAVICDGCAGSGKKWSST